MIDMKATDSLVVNGDNFDSATRLIFDPPLDTGFEMRVSRKHLLLLWRRCRTITPSASFVLAYTHGW